ncbi:MAG TPA: 1-deoxy-D-xylulose-5-phosphate reductoisomerase [bacterium]|nr:1-deoxy-D-xylulose-5-phosphate reductoisomerase [bacterium]
MKRVVIFGATGSIGNSTLAVIRRFPDDFRVVGLSGHCRHDLLQKQVREFRPEAVAFSGPAPESGFQAPGARVLTGPGGLDQLADWPGVDLFVLAIPGSDALPIALRILESGRPLALASKEAMVMAGELLTATARRRRVRIIPLDSEHNAIFQILESNPDRPVRRIYLTASGGPFFRRRRPNVSITEALAHPVWKMGRKVSIDSATMVNKALEVIEAHYLFNLPPEKIGVLIHPEVTVHGLVEFEDGFVLANLSRPDMRMPIAYGLFWPDPPPDRPAVGPVDLVKLGRLTFHKPSRKQFPALSLAYRVLEKGGLWPAAFSVANETAVAAFLEGRIPFESIVTSIKQTLNRLDGEITRRPAGLKEITDITERIRGAAVRSEF